MPRPLRVLAALSLLLSFVALAVATAMPGESAEAASSASRARLGGTEATFAARYGKHAGDAATGETFKAKGFKAITVTFDGDRADLIVIEPSSTKGWSEQDANDAALKFLPADTATDRSLHDTGDGRFEVACTSKDLGLRFGKSDYKRLHHSGKPGECYWLLSPSAPGVYGRIEISIGRAGSLDRPVPTATPMPTATAVPPTPTPDTSTYVAADGCTYRNADGGLVSCPVSADTPPPGATAKCNDGTWSYSAHHQGSCSHHGGVAYFLD